MKTWTWALALGLLAPQARAAGARYLVSFRDGAAPSRRAAALRRLGAVQDEELAEIGAVVAEVPAGSARVFEASAALDPDVASFAEDGYRIWLVDAWRAPFPSPEQIRSFLAVPARPEAAPPASVTVDGAELPWGIARVNAPAAWSVTRGEGVKVAVIDTGIDCTHPDLAPNCAGGYNALDASKPAFDDNSHGSHVSGTIAAVLDGKGVVGVAPKARLYAVKVLDKDGGGGIVSIVKGLIWAGRNRMDVANMSLGAPAGSVFMHAAINYAKSRGVALFAAAGNTGKDVEWPGAYADAIAVAALAPGDGIASFSSRGREVEFIAPGVDVRSSVPGGRWDVYDGTSMATPHMTGLGALAVARGAHGLDAVRAALKAAAAPVPGLSRDEQGAGVVDAAKLVH